MARPPGSVSINSIPNLRKSRDCSPPNVGTSCLMPPGTPLAWECFCTSAAGTATMKKCPLTEGSFESAIGAVARRNEAERPAERMDQSIGT